MDVLVTKLEELNTEKWSIIKILLVNLTSTLIINQKWNPNTIAATAIFKKMWKNSVMNWHWIRTHEKILVREYYRDLFF